MPSYFPCPNTQCSYQFDADILPPAALVTCPLCRTKFPYRAARPVPPAVGGDAPAPGPAGPRVVNIRDRPQTGGLLAVVLWIVGTVAVLGTLAAVLYVWSNKPESFVNRGSDHGEQTDPKFNLKLEPFPPEYAEDVTAREAIGANVFTRKRTGPDGWTAMAARDFKDRNARPAELDEMIRTRLRAALTGPEIVPAEAGETWAGQPARALVFSGDFDGTQVKGQALAIAHQGFAYVYFAWAAERDWDGLRAELLGLREKFQFLSPRSDWESKTADVVVYEGPGFQVADKDAEWILGKPTDQWKPKEKRRYEVDDPKAEDPAAVMMFRAAYQPKAGGDARRLPAEAYAVVAELSTAGDPLKVAEEHVNGRISKEYKGLAVDVQLEPLPMSPAGIALPTDGPAIGRYRVRNPLDRSDTEMWVISAVPVGGKVVAVEIKAKEKEATFVEQWMVNLAASLKAR